MKTPPRGFDINVDDYIEANIKKYPRFESVNAGYWLYGKPKELLKGVLENRKTQLYYIYNITNAISTIGSLDNINSDCMNDGVVDKKDGKFKGANYTVALNQLQRDLKQHKDDYAKTFVFEQLLKTKL